MDVVAMVALGAVPPFLVLAWIVLRGSPGGRVRSLAERKDAGRTVDTHAVHDRTEAAEAAQKHVQQRTNGPGLLARLRGRREG
ncbi:hypothetical protein [Halorubellus salinus]|uniref:hypothetical protein n=1 Tax=Halorubellus salinus TaxID=755309 RepID=UPI001D06FD8F|nr:hypothetical protein [Halorubellus salinus]